MKKLIEWLFGKKDEYVKVKIPKIHPKNCYDENGDFIPEMEDSTTYIG